MSFRIVLVLFFLAVAVLSGSASGSEDKVTDYKRHVLRKVFLVKTKEELKAEKELEEQQRPRIVTFLDNYGVGISAYLQNDYSGCVHHMEAALQGYHEYYETVSRCRVGCEIERNNRKPLFPENPEHLHFFEGVLAKTMCLKRCLVQQLTNVPKYFSMDEWHKNQFETRAPYEYLQLCYYKQNEILKAVQSTYTVLVVRPDDHLSTSNMKYYTTLPEFDEAALRDLEEKRFVSLYVDGIKAYDKEEWSRAINLLENSLELYIDEEANCRAFCENGFDQGWFPDFISSTASEFIPRK